METLLVQVLLSSFISILCYNFLAAQILSAIISNFLFIFLSSSPLPSNGWLSFVIFTNWPIFSVQALLTYSCPQSILSLISISVFLSRIWAYLGKSFVVLALWSRGMFRPQVVDSRKQISAILYLRLARSLSIFCVIDQFWSSVLSKNLFSFF